MTERERALWRQQMLIDINLEDALIRPGPTGHMEAYSTLPGKTTEIVLRDMTGGPQGRTTILLRGPEAGQRDLVKACLQSPEQIKQFVAQHLLSR